MRNMDILPKDNMLLKLIDLKHSTIENYIKTYIEHDRMFDKTIPRIYIYGELYTQPNKELGSIKISEFIITKKYDNYRSLLELNYKQSIRYIMKLLLFLIKLKEHDIIYRNFKFHNLGYDFIDGYIEPVILEYTDLTLLKKDDKYFNSFINGCDTCTGTLIPYFIIKDFFNKNTEWRNKLDKIYTIGLAETIIYILYKQDKVMEELFKLLYEPSNDIDSIHYFTYYNLFHDEKKKSIFFNLIRSLTPKFIQFDNDRIKFIFIKIIINCFENNYNSIYYPEIYFKNIEQIYGDLDKEAKERGKQLIDPIDDDNKFIIDIKKEPFKSSEDIQHIKTNGIPYKLPLPMITSVNKNIINIS